MPQLSFAEPAPADTSSAGSFRVTTRDASFVAGGVAMTTLGLLLLDPRTRDVPPSGLDPEDIRLKWDRDSIEDPNPFAGETSNVLLATSLLYPGVLAWATGGERSRSNSLLHAWTIQAEALALSVGTMSLIKVATSRPRPFAYLPESERPDDPAYDVTDVDTFRSFPSGHTTAAWASSMSGISYLATQRPDLPFATHFLSGFLGGGLATGVSLLRVAAGKHFPTDVVTGAIVGSSFGVGMALLQKPSRKEPTGPAWKAELLGLAAGVAAALLFTPPTSPWVN